MDNLLSSVLNQHINIVSERDRGLYHELTLGCLRQWFSIKAITYHCSPNR